MEEQDKSEDKEKEQDELYEHFRFVTDPGQSPIRIDKYLLDKLERISRNRIQNGIKAGGVLVDDKQVKSNYKVRPNQTIRIILPNPPRNFDIVPEDIPLDIVYEDDSLIVVNKASGMVVHPGHGNYSGTLVNALRFHLQNQDLPIKEGNFSDRPGLVHRIDKETSGLLVIAKTDYAMTHLSKQFFDHSIERSYQAIIWGQPDEEKGTITGHIGRNPYNRLQMTVFPDGEEGKDATTHFELIEPMYYVSVVQCKLETGRTHQIRVHFKHKGHPIFNDQKYGGNNIVKGTVFSKYKVFVQNCFKILPRQGLHAKSLGFIHPETNEKMFFDSELPDDMKAVLDKWRHYVTHSKSKLD